MEDLDRIEVMRDETGLFEGLAQRAARAFGGVDVTARLNPIRGSVTMQYYPSCRQHERRRVR